MELALLRRTYGFSVRMTWSNSGWYSFFPPRSLRQIRNLRRNPPHSRCFSIRDKDTFLKPCSPFDSNRIGILDQRVTTKDVEVAPIKTTLLDASIRMKVENHRLATDQVFIQRRWRAVNYEEYYLMEYALVVDTSSNLRVFFYTTMTTGRIEV